MHAPLSRRHLLILAVITLLGLAMRVGALQRSVVEDPVRGDAAIYFSCAVNLKTDGIYSRAMPTVFGGGPVTADASAPPVFPAFIWIFLGEEWRRGTLEGVYTSVRPVLTAQVLLSALLPLLVFFTGRRLLGNPMALAFAGLAALWPHLVNVNIYLLTEPVFIVLFWTSLCLLAAATAPGARPWLAVAAGAALAAAALTRPTVQYLPLVLLVFLWLRDPAHWRRWTALALTCLAILVAWGLRNIAATGAFGDPHAMTATLQHGSYPDFMFNGMPASEGIPYSYDQAIGPGTPLREVLAIIAGRASAAPWQYLHWYLIGKPLALFNWQIIPIGADTPKLLLTRGDIYIYPTPVTPYATHPAYVGTYLLARLLHWPLLVLAAISAVVAWLPAGQRLFSEARDLARLLSLVFLYVLAIHMVGAAFPRYSIPFLPLAWLLAGGLLAGLLRLRQASGPAGGAA